MFLCVFVVEDNFMKTNIFLIIVFNKYNSKLLVLSSCIIDWFSFASRTLLETRWTLVDFVILRQILKIVKFSAEKIVKNLCCCRCRTLMKKIQITFLCLWYKYGHHFHNFFNRFSNKHLKSVLRHFQIQNWISRDCEWKDRQRFGRRSFYWVLCSQNGNRQRRKSENRIGYVCLCCIQSMYN